MNKRSQKALKIPSSMRIFSTTCWETVKFRLSPSFIYQIQRNNFPPRRPQGFRSFRLCIINHLKLIALNQQDLDICIGNAICNLALISTSKFFKDHRIPRARRASAICSLWNIYKCLLHHIPRENTLLLVKKVHEKKHHRKSRQTKFWKRCYL